MDSALEIAEFVMRHPDFGFTLRGERDAVRLEVTKPGRGGVQWVVGNQELELAKCNVLLLHLEAMVEGLNSVAIGESIPPVRD